MSKLPDLQFAMMDSSHVLTPLFRSVQKGKRSQSTLDVTYGPFNGVTIQFTAKELLAVDDMKVMLALIAMSGPDGRPIEAGAVTEPADQLAIESLFKPDTQKFKVSTVEVHTSYRALAREMGLVEGGNTTARIKKSLKRLFQVSIFIEKPGVGEIALHLMKSQISEEKTGRVNVLLNPIAAAAVLGKARFVQIRLDEQRALSTDPASLIHYRLSGFINEGSKQTVGMSKLCAYVWGDTKVTPSGQRTRESRVREALQELIGIGWDITEPRDDIFLICRPKVEENADKLRAAEESRVSPIADAVGTIADTDSDCSIDAIDPPALG